MADLRLAPFHLLASEGAVHTGRDHAWHMDVLARVCAADPEVMLATPFRVVDVTDLDSQGGGGPLVGGAHGARREGIVVKPLDFVAKGQGMV